MIKKLSTAAILTTTILGSTLPFAYGMEKGETPGKDDSSPRTIRIQMKVNPDGSYEFLKPSVPLSTPIEENPQGIPAVRPPQQNVEDAVLLHQQAADILAATQKQAQDLADEIKEQQQRAAALIAQQEEFANHLVSLEQDKKTSEEEQKRLAEGRQQLVEEQQRLAEEKKRMDDAQQLVDMQRKLIEEERQKIAAAHQAAEAQRKIEEERQQAAAAQERARREREAEELLNQAAQKLTAWLGNVDGKISRHNRRVDERANNAQWKQHTKGKAVKNHYLAVAANDDPNQTLIKLSATDDNLFSTLKSKWDRFPELQEKMMAAKLAKIKQDLGITSQ